MLQTRLSNERGFADHGWLKTYHSFSFADYYDPQNMGFKSLRVINEDRIAGGRGFGAHSHRNMEIITYIVKGALQHKDSMGTESVIRPGEVQYMSAGTGVVHSEFNATANQETHLFQIWIMPKANGGSPQYDQKDFSQKLLEQTFVLAASGDGRDGSIQIRQDADFWIGHLNKGEIKDFKLSQGRGIYLHCASGAARLNGNRIQTGDAIKIEEEGAITMLGEDAHSEILLFDLV